MGNDRGESGVVGYGREGAVAAKGDGNEDDNLSGTGAGESPDGAGNVEAEDGPEAGPRGAAGAGRSGATRQ
jgi:hypothetical protein